MPDPHENLRAAVARPALAGARDFAVSSPRPHVPLLVQLHAVLFSVGVLCLLVGAFVNAPALLLIAGPALALSGLLIWVGSRITFSGPLGDMLRIALGRRRMLTLHLRAAIWLLIGALVTAWGVHALSNPYRHETPLLRQPLAAEHIR